MRFELTARSIDLESFGTDLHGPEEGGVVRFVGVARMTSHRTPKEVVRLEYEAYEPMAREEMDRILAEAASKYGLRKALVVHRVGAVEVGEPAVAIQVATPHRAEAFDACRYLIDELKKRVPIWKKERFATGAARWVEPKQAEVQRA